MKNNTVDWEDDFRTQFDELKLKPPKGSIRGAERELIIWYFRNLIKEIYAEMYKATYDNDSCSCCKIVERSAQTRGIDISDR